MLYYVICGNKWFRMVHSQHHRFCDAVKVIDRLKKNYKNWEFSIDEEKQIDDEVC